MDGAPADQAAAGVELVLEPEVDGAVLALVALAPLGRREARDRLRRGGGGVGRRRRRRRGSGVVLGAAGRGGEEAAAVAAKAQADGPERDARPSPLPLLLLLLLLLGPSLAVAVDATSSTAAPSWTRGLLRTCPLHRKARGKLAWGRAIDEEQGWVCGADAVPLLPAQEEEEEASARIPVLGVDSIRGDSDESTNA